MDMVETNAKSIISKHICTFTTLGSQERTPKRTSDSNIIPSMPHKCFCDDTYKAPEHNIFFVFDVGCGSGFVCTQRSLQLGSTHQTRTRSQTHAGIGDGGDRGQVNPQKTVSPGGSHA